MTRHRLPLDPFCRFVPSWSISSSAKTHRVAKLRCGFSFIEMIVASASTAILLGGLASSIVVVSKAFDTKDAETTRQLNASFVADEFFTDLHFATGFTERTATAVTFEVPDRDGDGTNETLRYAWDGNKGSPLTRALNGSTPEPILADIASLNLKYVTRTVTGLEAPITTLPGVNYEGFTAARETRLRDEVNFEIPGNTSVGDLLVLAVTLDESVATDLMKPLPGWTLLSVEPQPGMVALGIWTRIADGSEPSNGYKLDLNGATQSFALVMRFTGHAPDQPIGSIETRSGFVLTSDPRVPAAVVERENSIALRLGAFTGDSIKQDSPGADGHKIITTDEVNAFSAAAAYIKAPGKGTVASTSFDLRMIAGYATATVVIQPEEAH